MRSFARFLADQVVREWRDEQRAKREAEDRQRSVTGASCFASWRMRFHVGQRVWLGQIDVRVKEIRADGIVLIHARRGGSANYFFNEHEVVALIADGRLRPFEVSPS